MQLVLLIAMALPAAAEPASPGLGCYISTGDNHWLGTSLPIDSAASIEASFDLLARLGVRTVYWRGLEEATWNDTMVVREENCRYASFFRWMRALYQDLHPDRLAVAAAHRRGLQIWGVGTLVDWGCQADAPGFGDWPSPAESRLRQEHPEWVPVDRSGLLRQGGPIEFAYPAARRALVDLHMKYVRADGYDGVLFLTYAENYSMRFQDEFGYSEPIVREFKRRTGVDLRTQPFTRTGSPYDWYALRGEYLTQYLRELKTELGRDKKKLGLFVNPQQPRFTQPWNVPELMLTAGHIYVDLETQIREAILDRLMVYGYCHPMSQNRAVDDCLWLTRQTRCTVGALTSSPFSDRWTAYRKQGVEIALAVNDDQAYLERGPVPEQPPSALESGDLLLRLRVLAQIIAGKTKVAAQRVTPLAGDQNLLVRRLALLALGKLKDPVSVPVIEQGLDDAENSVRCMAVAGLMDNHRPESTARMLSALERHPTHPLAEMMYHALPRIRPLPRAELAAAAKHAPPLVRSTAMRALTRMSDKTLLPVFAAGLSDSDRFVRFASAEGLGNIGRCPPAVERLVEALEHDDPVVSDRAARSLGVIVGRAQAEIEPLRPRIAAGLKSLFTKLGDGCRRVDADWGYRPVGNALLKLGPEGQKILEAFLAQRTNRRLAFLAWKTLWVRQEAGTFSEVSEKENAEAFRQLPEWARP